MVHKLLLLRTTTRKSRRMWDQEISGARTEAPGLLSRRHLSIVEVQNHSENVEHPGANGGGAPSCNVIYIIFVIGFIVKYRLTKLSPSFLITLYYLRLEEILNTILVAFGVFTKLASLSKMCWHETYSKVGISSNLCCPIYIQDVRSGGFTVIYCQFLIWTRSRNSGKAEIKKYLSASSVIFIYWVKAFVLKENTEMASDANRNWQVNCNRRGHGASCHSVATDTWHVLSLLRDTFLGATVSRCLKLHGYYVEIWCVPSATYVLCINRSHSKFLPIRVVATLYIDTVLHLVICVLHPGV